MSKFNQYGDSETTNILNGSEDIYGYTLRANNLEGNQPVKSNQIGQLVSSKLDINDVNNLQNILNDTITSPFGSTLIASDFSTASVPSLNSYASLISGAIATLYDEQAGVNDRLNTVINKTQNIISSAVSPTIETVFDGEVQCNNIITNTIPSLNAYVSSTDGRIDTLENKTQNITATGTDTDITGKLKVFGTKLIVTSNRTTIDELTVTNNIFASGNIGTELDIDANGSITAQGNITAFGDVISASVPSLNGFASNTNTAISTLQEKTQNITATGTDTDITGKLKVFGTKLIVTSNRTTIDELTVTNNIFASGNIGTELDIDANGSITSQQNITAFGDVISRDVPSLNGFASNTNTAISTLQNTDITQNSNITNLQTKTQNITATGTDTDITGKLKVFGTKLIVTSNRTTIDELTVTNNIFASGNITSELDIDANGSISAQQNITAFGDVISRDVPSLNGFASTTNTAISTLQDKTQHILAYTLPNRTTFFGDIITIDNVECNNLISENVQTSSIPSLNTAIADLQNEDIALDGRIDTLENKTQHILAFTSPNRTTFFGDILTASNVECNNLISETVQTGSILTNGIVTTTLSQGAGGVNTNVVLGSNIDFGNVYKLVNLPTINGIRPSGGVYTESSTLNLIGAQVERNILGDTGVGSISSGSLLVPGGAFVAGDTYAFKIGGTITCDNNDVFIIRLRTNFGSSPSPILTTVNVSVEGAQNNGWWELEVEFIIASLGIAEVASIRTNGNYTYYNATGFAKGYGVATLENATFNTTIDNTLAVTYQTADPTITAFRPSMIVLTKLF